jgi:hypothetical protein
VPIPNGPAAHAHRDGLVGAGLAPQLARLRDLLARRSLDLLTWWMKGFQNFSSGVQPSPWRPHPVISTPPWCTDVAVEVLGEEAAHDLADVGRHEASRIHLHVPAVLEREMGGVVEGRPMPCSSRDFTSEARRARAAAR